MVSINIFYMIIYFIEDKTDGITQFPLKLRISVWDVLKSAFKNIKIIFFITFKRKIQYFIGQFF